MIGLAFTIYISLMLLVGYLAYRRTSSLSDYILGGRRLGSWVTALSASASDMSGWLLLGLPGYAYAAGLEATWIAIGLFIGTWLNWQLIAARLRHYSFVAGDSQTLPEFFEKRFADNSHLLRMISALVILLFYLFYTSSGLVAGAKLFNSVFSLPYHTALLVGTGVILLYIVFGGFLAVSWTDLIQGLLMAAALVAVPMMLWIREDHTSIESPIDPALLDIFSNAQGEPLTALAIVSLLAWGLGYFGQPHILARFKAIRSIDDIPKARVIALSWVAITLSCAVWIGFSGISFFSQPLPDGEKVFILLVQTLFHPLIAGICLAAILAAIMSTADSQLLVSASSFTNDIYKVIMKRKANEKELIWTGRTAVTIIALIAVTLAWDPENSVLELVAYAWAGFGAAFGPTLILALFWRRMNRFGALAGILVGGASVIIWKQLQGGLFDIYEIVPGFLFSLIAIVVFSLLTPRPNGEIMVVFDKVSRD